MVDFESKTALVTGAGRGIGRAVALALAADGWRLALTWHRDEAALSEVCAEVEAMGGGSPLPLRCEQLSPESCAGVVAATLTEFGRLDGLVANAGIWNPDDRPIEDWSVAAIDELLRINLHAVLHLVGRAAPALKASGRGRIVAIGSTAGVRGEAGHAPYAASKGALLALVRSWTAEMAGDGVTANVVSPGWVRTDMTQSALAPPKRATIEAAIPTGRVSEPEDIAAAVRFLMTEGARQVSGINLDVNGGAVFS